MFPPVVLLTWLLTSLMECFLVGARDNGLFAFGVEEGATQASEGRKIY